MMKFRDIELDFDVFDAESAERYEKALEKVQRDSKAPAGARMSEKIRKQCEVVNEFFDSVIGEGFHKSLFGDKMNLMDAVKAFKEFVETVNDRGEEVRALTAEVQEKLRSQKKTAGK